MKKTTNAHAQATRTLEHSITESSYVLALNLLIEQGWTLQPEAGERGNDGKTFAFEDAYVEVWDNHDKAQPTVAVRPVKRLMDKKELDLWNANKSVRVTSPETHKTHRLACKTEEALYMVLTRCTALVQAEKDAQAKKAVQAKKGVA